MRDSVTTGNCTVIVIYYCYYSFYYFPFPRAAVRGRKVHCVSELEKFIRTYIKRYIAVSAQRNACVRRLEEVLMLIKKNQY